MDKSRLWKCAGRAIIGGLTSTIIVAGAPATAVAQRVNSGPDAPAIDLIAHSMGGWGIDLAARDPAVKPGDDFFMATNGAWYAKAVIPPAMTAAGAWFELRMKSVWREQAILEAAAANTTASPESIEGKVGAFYRAYMNESRAEAIGLTPLRSALDGIRAADNRRELSGLMGLLAGPGTVRAFNTVGVPTGRGVFALDISQDPEAPARYAVYLSAPGVMLPAASFYVDPKAADLKTAYEAHVAKVLSLIGWPDAAVNAKQIVAFETRIAQAVMDDGGERDAVPTHIAVAELSRLAPGMDWRAYLTGAELGNVKSVLVDSRKVVSSVASIFSETPVPVLQARLAFATAAVRAQALNNAMRAADFEFRTLSGRGVVQAPRARSAALTIEANMGDALGALYVRQYFSPAARAQAQEMADNLRAAMSARIEQATWLSLATKAKAHAKLAKLVVKIGYPDKVESYKGLEISDVDLYGNAVRSADYNWHRLVRQLNSAVDRGEWIQTFPQTVNTFGSRQLNDAGYPAGLLQPPFLDPNADAAVNYGGLGAFMGAAIVDGFNSGRHFDGDGRRVEWWTPDESATFLREAAKLNAQYSAFEPLPGLHVNGDQTLTGSLNDLGGLVLALDAYRLSLRGKPAPVIDGFTGDQRFFMGWAQFWRLKFRPEFIRNQVGTDPNSPAIQRANGPVRNMDAWYEAFNVQPGDRLYIAPESRARIW